tara:strand:+ start:316 stop:471 length:156 start_codon:yes stop_codon:yes gene_type:complete
MLEAEPLVVILQPKLTAVEFKVGVVVGLEQVMERVNQILAVVDLEILVKVK